MLPGGGQGVHAERSWGPREPGRALGGCKLILGVAPAVRAPARETPISAPPPTRGAEGAGRLGSLSGWGY